MTTGTEKPRYFIILRGPGGPRPMTGDEDGQFLALFHTPEEARETVKNHAAVRAFGAEIFELDTAEEEIL